MHTCPKCGTEFEGNFCPECGEKFVEEKTCPKCGKTLAGNAKFCNICGYSFYEKPAPAQAPAQTAPTPKPKPARQLTSGTQKLYSFVSVFPTALFVMLSAVLLLFFLAPVAVMPGGEFFGESIPSESYGNVYEIANYEGSSLTGSLTALIVFVSFSLFVVLLLGILSLFSKLRYRRVTLFGKSIFLRNVFTAIGYVLFFVLFLISCILLGQISSEDGGFGVFTASAAPILILVFTLIGCLTAVGCAVAGKYLRSAYPALVTAQEKKIAAAKPTKFESWVKSHKKLTAVLSSVLVVAIIVGVTVPVSIANRHNGVYYAYNGETEEYNTERFFKLSGGTWEDESGNKGKIEFDGENVTLSYDRSNGMDKTGTSTMKLDGTLIDDVLKIGGTVFAKEGHKHNGATLNCPCGHLNLSVELKSDGTYSIKGIGAFIGSDLIVPSDYLGIPITEIGKDAFYNCSWLKSVKIPNSVTSIGEYAFQNCTKLTSIEIPDSVTSIGKHAFYNCNWLASIEIPDSVTSIGSDAFYGTAYYNDASHWDASGVLYIGDRLIDTKIKISGAYAVRQGTKTIEDSAFENRDELTSIEIPDGVTSIGNYAFCYCRGLESVTIGNGVTEIGKYAFDSCSGLTNITIPDSVTLIGKYAFYDCRGLESVTIGSNVTLIDGSTFRDCLELTAIQFKGAVEDWQAIQKGSDWDYNTGNYTVTCTDGTVTKDGTVTYF